MPHEYILFSNNSFLSEFHLYYCVMFILVVIYGVHEGVEQMVESVRPCRTEQSGLRWRRQI